MILQNGAKVLVAHRRMFETDHSRFFLGVVEGYEDGIAIVSGHTWVRSGYVGEFERKADERCKLIAITSGTVFVYVLPTNVTLKSMHFAVEGTAVYLRGDGGFEMDLSEGVLHAGETLPRTRRSA